MTQNAEGQMLTDSDFFWQTVAMRRVVIVEEMHDDPMQEIKNVTKEMAAELLLKLFPRIIDQDVEVCVMIRKRN